MKKIFLLSLVLLIGLSGCWPFGDSTELSNNDYHDIYAVIDDYQEAIILYSAIVSTSTDAVTYDTWQSWVAQNSDQWEQLQQDSVFLSTFKNANHAYAADNSFSTDKLSAFPVEFEERLLAGIDKDAQNFGLQVDAFKNIISSEYKEVAVTADLKTYTNPTPSIISRISGYRLPFPTTDSITNFLINGSFKLTDKILGTNIADHIEISDAPFVIVDDGKNIEINSNYQPKSFAVSDVKNIANKSVIASKELFKKKGFMYIVNKTFSQPEQLILDVLVNYANQSDLVDKPLNLKNQSGEITLSESQTDQSQLIRDYGLQTTLKSIFPPGEFVINGSKVNNSNSIQSDTSSATSNKSDLKPNNYTGTYTTTFTTESMSIVSNTTITFTIDENNQIVVNLNMDAPTSTYSYPGSGASGSITSTGSATFSGIYNPKNNLFDLQSQMVTTSTTIIGGASDTNSFTDTVTLRGSIVDGAINGTATSTTFGSTDFIAVK